MAALYTELLYCISKPEHKIIFTISLKHLLERHSPSHQPLGESRLKSTAWPTKWFEVVEGGEIPFSPP